MGDLAGWRVGLFDRADQKLDGQSAEVGLIEVDGGQRRFRWADRPMLSNPTTATSVGTCRPAASSMRRAAMAIRSL